MGQARGGASGRRKRGEQGALNAGIHLERNREAWIRVLQPEPRRRPDLRGVSVFARVEAPTVDRNPSRRGSPCPARSYVFAWFAFVLSALFAGRRRPATLCTFAGMTVSALMSTVFDERTLLDFSDFGGYGVADFALSWTSALLYLGFGWRLASGGNRRDWLLASGCAALFSFLLPVCFADKAAPKVRNGCVVSGGAGAPLVLYDPSWTLSAMLPYLDEGFVMPLDPGDFSGPFDRIWYFGDAAEYSFSHPDARHVFLFPSEFFEPPSGTDSVVRE